MFKKQKRLSRGFTLIELLVVIAIIGLLAGIVLVSLGGARDEARDARVVAAMGQARTIAELIYNASNPLAYTAVCDTPTAGEFSTDNPSYGTDLQAIETDVFNNNGGTNPTCEASATEYCAYAPVATASTWSCIDSTGKAVETTTPPSAVGLCDGATFVCP